MKKLLKILLIFVVSLIIIVGLILAWLFSNSGNEFLKNKITQIANEKAPIGLEFTHFKLKFSTYEFAITDKQKSQIALQGKYSLFTLNTDATLNAFIKNLAPYEPLLGIKLNGSLALNGDISKKGNIIDTKLDIKAFDSEINANISLEDYAPKRLFINTKEDIQIASLLKFLSQPLYANGKLKVAANMDITDIAKPKGKFQIASVAISPNLALLKKDFNLILPKDSIAFSLNGEAKEGKIISTILAHSSYLDINSKDLSFLLEDFSSNGKVFATLQKFNINNFAPKTPINLALSLKSSSLKDQKIALKLNAITQPIGALIEAPSYTPKSLILEAKQLNLKEILEFLALGYEAQGEINLNAKVEDINLQDLSYKVNGNLNSKIQTLAFNGMNLAQNNSLNASFSGDSKKINIKANSDLFDSQINANTALYDYAPKNIAIDIKKLNLQKLAGLFGFSANGELEAEANLKDFDKGISGEFKINSPSILLSKATLNELSGMNFKQDLQTALEGNGSFKKGLGEAKITLNSKDFKINLPNINLDLSKQNYSSDFAINIFEVASINPTSMNLKGALSLDGSFALNSGIPSFKIQNKDFGDNLEAELKNEHFNLEAKNISMQKIAKFSGMEKLIKNGLINANASLDIKGKDTQTILSNLTGNARLSGSNFEIYSIDIDGLVSNYENTNQVNLLDIGAFVLAGPFGIAATKGSDVGMLGFNAVVSSKSLIKQIEANFDINNGVANAKDVAFATNKTRIAAKGAIHLKNETFDNFIIAILDDKNCAKISQKIKGTLSNPKIEFSKATVQTAINLATSLFGKIKKGTQKVTDPILGTQNAKCEPFYNGVVKQPR
ncbi:AsmA-like C-terminal region-containing protein [Helicobacter burdigaliensis]|uniref:AsmA-like C-terminal region-containing protein n=1 Tax=Helicobacter burdigaliensis TaxID=2315334 RepID=UPI000EF650AE|nr:AsmA-like C-terminal region-containing protein [Helicobacter burdigaliensis]